MTNGIYHLIGCCVQWAGGYIHHFFLSLCIPRRPRQHELDCRGGSCNRRRCRPQLDPRRPPHLQGTQARGFRPGPHRASVDRPRSGLPCDNRAWCLLCWPRPGSRSCSMRKPSFCLRRLCLNRNPGTSCCFLPVILPALKSIQLLSLTSRVCVTPH
jgi:hypothetical protein